MMEFTDAQLDLLRRAGFEPWGKNGWVRFAPGEEGDTCYDDEWALEVAQDVREQGHLPPRASSLVPPDTPGERWWTNAQ